MVAPYIAIGEPFVNATARGNTLKSRPLKIPGIRSGVAVRWWRDENERRAAKLVGLFGLIMLATVVLYLLAVLG